MIHCRRKMTVPFFAILSLLLPSLLFAQEVEQQAQPPLPESFAAEAEKLLDLLREEALLMEISATVVDQKNSEIIWFTEISEITVFGKQVQVRINGSHLVVHADFTPYVQDPRQLMLLAQGQTWIRARESNEVSYQSALRSIPIVLGEPVLFYPLGLDLTEAALGKAVLELQVTVRSLAEALNLEHELGSGLGSTPVIPPHN